MGNCIATTAGTPAIARAAAVAVNGSRPSSRSKLPVEQALRTTSRSVGERWRFTAKVSASTLCVVPSGPSRHRTGTFLGPSKPPCPMRWST